MYEKIIKNIKLPFFIVIFILLGRQIFAQMNQADINTLPSLSYYNKTETNFTSKLAIGALLVITPDVTIEKGKVYFGLTKEISAGVFPFGRVAFEYTYLFGGMHKNNFRASYFLDVPVMGESDVFLALSPGFGYYTETQRKGLCAQFEIGILANPGFGRNIMVHPYIKFRRTFIKGQGNSDYSDVSLGCGLALYYNLR